MDMRSTSRFSSRRGQSAAAYGLALVVWVFALSVGAQSIMSGTPIVASVAPFVDGGLREVANITLRFSVDDAASQGASYIANCAAEGIEPSCVPDSLTPQASGAVDVGKDFQLVTIPAVPYANATGRYTCAVNVLTGDDSATSDCKLVVVPPPKAHPRVNLVDFMSPAYAGMRNLLQLSMAEVQSRPVEDATGYFTIAGIHGRNVSYNGTEQQNNATSNVGGWCQHGSTLFPVFHRAYQMQIEKALRHYAEQIAVQYEDPVMRDYYVESAQKLRLPYWDWTSTETVANGVNNFFLVEQVAVRVPPLGEPTFIANPFRNYTFQEEISFSNSVWKLPGVLEYKTYLVGESTVRHPELVTLSVSNYTLMNSNVRFAAQSTWIPGVVDMFQNQKDYAQFSNHFATTTFGRENASLYGMTPSLELFHDNIHDSVGGWGGTMHFVPIAPYDPIFWFHHNNVERQFELWQLMNPDKWLEPSKSVTPTNTMSVVIDEIVDGNTPLPPFRGPSGDFVTANTIRDLRSMTSTYPDVKAYMDSDLTPEQIRQAVVLGMSVNGNYNQQFNTSYVVQVNATVNATDLPVSGGKIHVYLMPDVLPSLGTNSTTVPSYCGFVDLETIDQAEESTIPINGCMRAKGFNFYPTLNYIAPPWSEKDMLDPTRRFKQNDAGPTMWALQPDAFEYIVEGADGSDIGEFVVFGDPSVYYSYNTQGLSFVNKAAAPPPGPAEIFWGGLNNGDFSGKLPSLLEDASSEKQSTATPSSENSASVPALGVMAIVGLLVGV